MGKFDRIVHVDSDTVEINGRLFNSAEEGAGGGVSATSSSTSTKMIGSLFVAPAGMTEADGLLPLIDGYSIADGSQYPLFLAKLPAFAAASGIEVPVGFNGKFVRNLGGNAETFMTPQEDATAPNGLGVSSRFARSTNTPVGGGAFRLTGAGSNVTVNGTVTGDVETRPENFGMQYYLILDTF